jgi:hypothetical protein
VQNSAKQKAPPFNQSRMSLKVRYLLKEIEPPPCSSGRRFMAAAVKISNGQFGRRSLVFLCGADRDGTLFLIVML